MERHRSLRQAFEVLRSAGFSDLRCLQLSRDPSIALGWFREAEQSTYGQENTRDIQALPDATGAWDVVVCNHVLEHVERPDDAVRELARINSDTGFLALSYPNPVVREKTVDWGYPNPEQHHHYRIFGRDYELVMRRLLPDRIIVAASIEDPVTKVPDLFYLVTRSQRWVDTLAVGGVPTRFVSR